MDSPPSPAHVQELRASLLADTEALEAHLRSSQGQALSLDIALQIRAIVTQNRFLISRLGSAYVALLMGKELTQDQIAEIERIAEYIRKNKEPDEKVEKEEEKRVESGSSNNAGVAKDEEIKYVEQEKESLEKKEMSFEGIINEEEEKQEKQEEENIEETQDKQERKEEIEEKKEERTSVVLDVFTSPTPPPSLPVPVPSKTPVFYTSSEPLKTNKIVHFESPLLPSPQQNQQQYTLQETHLDENKNNIHIITTRDRLRRNSLIDTEVVNSDKEESSPAIEIDTELNQRASKLFSKEPMNNTEESTEITTTTTTTTENKNNEKTTPNIEKKKKERRERKHQHDSNNNTNNNNNRTQRRNITQTRTLYCLSCRLMMQQEEILALRLALGNNRERINILANSTEEALNVIRDPLPKYLDTLRQLKRGVGEALSSVNNLCSATSSVIPLLEEQSTSPSNAVPEMASRRVAAEDRAVARSITKTRELLKSLESPPPPPQPQPQLPSSSSSHVTTQQQPTAAAEQSLSTSISVDGNRLPDPRPVREALRQHRERPTYLQRFMRTGSPVGAAQLPGGVVKAPRI